MGSKREVDFTGLLDHERLRLLTEVNLAFSFFAVIKANARLRLKYKNRVLSFNRDFLRFLVYDRGFLSGFYSLRLGAEFLKFKGVFFSMLERKITGADYVGSRLGANYGDCFFLTRTHTDFSDLLIKLNSLVIFVITNRVDALFTSTTILEKITNAVIRALLRLVSGANRFTGFTASRIESFLLARIKLLFMFSNLSAVNLARLVVYVVTDYVCFFSRLSYTTIGSKNYMFLKKVVVRKLTAFQTRILFSEANCNLPF